jgi:hypothetical protein
MVTFIAENHAKPTGWGGVVEDKTWKMSHFDGFPSELSRANRHVV